MRSFETIDDLIYDLKKFGVSRELIADATYEYKKEDLKGYSVVTDGSKLGYNSIKTVNPTGYINIYTRSETHIEDTKKTLTTMWRKLHQISPVGKLNDKRPGHPGMYKNSHVVFVNNVLQNQINAGYNFNDLILTSGDVVEFVNVTVYARKFETEYKKQSYKNRRKKTVLRGPFSSQAPRGVYDVIVKNYKNRKRSQLVISRDFKRNLGLHTVMRKATGKLTEQMYPSIRMLVI